MGSYSSEVRGLGERIRDVVSLYRLHSRDAQDHVRMRIEDAKLVEARIKSHFDFSIEGLDVLEIGPGQFLTQLLYFSTKNRAVGIDSDVIVRGFDPAGYVRMLRHNQLYRTLKSIARKLMGVDHRYASQLKRYLGQKKLPHPRVDVMDVRAMSFPADSFDFVYCRSVLHQLMDPEKALDEIVRVLRPGGVVYISIHPYTSETGCLDPRIYTAQRSEVAGWPHLRPQLRDTLHKPNVRLNRMRLAQWRALFQQKMPGAADVVVSSGPDSLRMALTLQSQGELLDYSLEELLTGDFAVTWKKPARDQSPQPRLSTESVVF